MPTKSKKEGHLLWSALAEMNGGKGRTLRLCGRQFSFILGAFICTSIFLWSWEKNPLVSSLKRSEDQLVMPSTDIYMVKPHDISTSMDREGQIKEEYLHSKVVNSTRGEEMAGDFDSILINVTAPFSPERKDDIKVSTYAFQKKACNYAKGRWVADNRLPLYSGMGCKQWLAEMWACRLTTRSDFSYEKYRWQPEDCDMPEFDGLNFLRRMQDKTIAFVGDSLGRQQFQSLMCMATGGEEMPEVEDVGQKYGLVIPQGAIRPNGWAYRFPKTNTTILFYWSASLCDVDPLNIKDQATEFAMHLDRPPSFLRQYLSHFDILILNTGHHWNRGKFRANRWVMHVNGKPIEDRKLATMGNAKNFTIYRIVRWLDSQLILRPQLKAFFRTISPRHFFNGEWNSGGSCNNTTPLARGSEVFQDQSSDTVVEGAVKGTKVKILDITAISQLRDEGHISHYRMRSSDGVQDCLHWCLPGIPDTWNEILCAQL